MRIPRLVSLVILFVRIRKHTLWASLRFILNFHSCQNTLGFLFYISVVSPEYFNEIIVVEGKPQFIVFFFSKLSTSNLKVIIFAA